MKIQGNFLSYTLGCLFTLLSINVSFSQSSEVANMETMAKELMVNEQYHLALPIYLELDSLSPDNPKYLYPIGVCYLHAVEEEKSLTYFQKCLKDEHKFPNKLLFYTAKSYHLVHEFDNAIKYYEAYKDKITKHKNKKATPSLIDTNREIEMCYTGKQMLHDSLKIKIINLGTNINSPYPDHGPVLNADESVLIFTSSRPNTTGGMKDENDGRYYEDIYISYKTETDWTTPKSISENINTANHDASISLSADGQKLFLYKYTKEQNSVNASGDLFMSLLRGRNWTAPEKLSEQINSKGWEPSASFAADEKSMIFTSNREGGHGGTDLYLVKVLPNGEWAMPMNLGSRINTPYDEDSPFLLPDGKTLYFSSNGHKGMGGMDVFVSVYDEERKEWSAPKNVGYPISTAHDDVHFSWTADGRKVYFSSVRKGGFGDKDIYYSTVFKDASKLVVLKGIISDSISSNPLEATIKVTEKGTNELIGIFNSNSATGKYIVILPEGKDYDVSITSQNYNICTEQLDFSQLTEFEELEKNIKLCPRKP